MNTGHSKENSFFRINAGQEDAFWDTRVRLFSSFGAGLFRLILTGGEGRAMGRSP